MATKAQNEMAVQTENMKQTIATLGNMRPQLQQVLPPQINVDKFIRTASGAIQNNPDLLEADRKSLFMACQRAAQDGLIIDSREAALVMFNKNVNNKWVKMAQYMPMVAGILKKARNSGEIKSINAYAVYENDQFEYSLGMRPDIHHIPDLDEPGDFRLAYAVAELKDGGIQMQVMTKAQIEKVRKCSKSGNTDDGKPKGIWLQWYDEMAVKTVLRKLCKFLPSSTDLDGVIAASDEQFDINNDVEEKPAAKTPMQSSGRTKAESAILGDDEEKPPIDAESEVITDDDPI